MTKLEFDNLLQDNKQDNYSGWASCAIAAELGINGLVMSGRAGTVTALSDKITPIELMSLEALLCYVADQQQKDGMLVRTTFEKVFGIDDLKALPAKRYNEAVCFLVEGPVIQ